mmetsp:Transcript_85647/g.239254  ORF Transcript_85647/g.239254 Transcript_85647/m.239254 type:complete len:206 (+) Transcript_85647:1144-1761(+)
MHARPRRDLFPLHLHSAHGAHGCPLADRIRGSIRRGRGQRSSGFARWVHEGVADAGNKGLLDRGAKGHHQRSRRCWLIPRWRPLAAYPASLGADGSPEVRHRADDHAPDLVQPQTRLRSEAPPGHRNRSGPPAAGDFLRLVRRREAATASEHLLGVLPRAPAGEGHRDARCLLRHQPRLAPEVLQIRVLRARVLRPELQGVAARP